MAAGLERRMQEGAWIRQEKWDVQHFTSPHCVNSMGEFNRDCRCCAIHKNRL